MRLTDLNPRSAEELKACSPLLTAAQSSARQPGLEQLGAVTLFFVT